MKRFHIIIPTYKHQEFIDKCLESIENQDYPKELIKTTVIDDFSPNKLEIIKTSFECKLIRNKERRYAGYNRYLVYSQSNDNDILVFLDGDDWLSDNKCLKLINNIYQNNNIHWSISNHKLYQNGNLKVLPRYVKLPLQISKPKICHLRCGYGYVWNKMNIEWIKLNDGKFIKWMTDWNENLYALKNFGEPFKINTSLSVYNLDTSKTRKENNDYQNMIDWFVNKS